MKNKEKKEKLKKFKNPRLAYDVDELIKVKFVSLDRLLRNEMEKFSAEKMLMHSLFSDDEL